MIVNDKCSILWEVVRDDQHIFMKMCIEPQNTLVLNNITNFSVPSLQNTTQYTKNITNQTMNVSNPYNNTLNLSLISFTRFANLVCFHFSLILYISQ